MYKIKKSVLSATLGKTYRDEDSNVSINSKASQTFIHEALLYSSLHYYLRSLSPLIEILSEIRRGQLRYCRITAYGCQVDISSSAGLSVRRVWPLPSAFMK